MSLTSTAFWIGNFLVAQVSPIMLVSPLQTYGTFYFLAGTSFLASTYVLLTLPETKVASYLQTAALDICISQLRVRVPNTTVLNLCEFPLQTNMYTVMTLTFVIMQGMSLESIDALFSKPWLERTQVLYYLRYNNRRSIKTL